MKILLFICCTFLISILFFSIEANSQTHIPTGDISGTWYKTNSPYLIDGEIKIPYGKKLIIEPGVKVIFTGHYKLIVNGILKALGTEQDSIYFSPSDTSVGWHGIRFIEAEDLSTLEFCVLMYGKTSTPEELKMLEEIPCRQGEECAEWLDPSGGAILINKSHTKINHCLIANNFAARNGGGIYIKNYANPVIRYCHIINNKSFDGGGISSSRISNPFIYHCKIEHNYAENMGGGFLIDLYSNPVIDECSIKENIADSRGGGICFYTSAKPVVKNSTISYNTSALGGGIYIDEFYNKYREQFDKIDIRIINVRIENNTADYGGGIWLRDSQGELSGVTVCYNKAMIGGGINIEHNPMFLRFSSDSPCNIFMNFARIMGNDMFRLGGEAAIYIPLDTFTVKHYSTLNAEPLEKWDLDIKNFKLTQINADLYVNPDGNDYNSGLTASDPLQSLRIALVRILADSISPHTIYLSEGEYIFTKTNDVLLLNKHKYVSLKGAGFTEVIFGTDRITVFTPWWITTWALIIYALTLASIIMFIWNIRMRRHKIRSELEREKFEAEKMHEVDEMKNRFFANISHEFRTPLTLIFGPAKDVIEKTKEPDTKHSVGIIKKNASRLYSLVNQLLDISKLEAGKMKLEASEQNIIPLLKGYVLSFSSLAERKKIELSFSSLEKNLNVFVDEDKLDKIISNLLSNAFKFTPEGGEIDFTIEKLDEYVKIKVADSGLGIAAERLDKIFDRFYQVVGNHAGESEGTGIGLALTKELVELHKGKIEVESEYGKGSTFKVFFPLGKDHLKPEEIVEKEVSEEIKVAAEEKEQIPETPSGRKTNDIDLLIEKDKPLLLIVEDNADVRQYIIRHLEDDYRILEVANGEDGLREAFNRIPDLIVSDIMMPKVDGFELCEKLKSDERTSHIPVILLTAKATDKDKIEGYKTGVDDYIMKPFDSKVLKVRIGNLINQRRKLREHFKNEGLVDLDDKEITSVDKKFLKNVVQIINKYISDVSFNVETLADEISMSRRNLDRKLIALVGESPSDLIKRIRLTRASKLLTIKSGNISEIALEVGFSNPAHFSNCFRELFGVIPSDYQKNYSK